MEFCLFFRLNLPLINIIDSSSHLLKSSALIPLVSAAFPFLRPSIALCLVICTHVSRISTPVFLGSCFSSSSVLLYFIGSPSLLPRRCPSYFQLSTVRRRILQTSLQYLFSKPQLRRPLLMCEIKKFLFLVLMLVIFLIPLTCSRILCALSCLCDLLRTLISFFIFLMSFT